MVLNLCLAGDTLVSARVDTGIALTARVQYAAFSVETGASDVVISPQRSALARACADRRCVFYHQYCATVDGQAYCQLQIAGASGGYQRVLIRAASDLGVADGRRKLAYTHTQRGRQFQIPLGLMTRVSQDPQPPRCDGPNCRK